MFTNNYRLFTHTTHSYFDKLERYERKKDRGGDVILSVENNSCLCVGGIQFYSYTIHQ